MIDIITHCWAGGMDQYGYLLQYQLHSVAANAPQKTRVRVNVCTAEEDTLTRSVVSQMREHLEIREHLFELPDLMRRAIGRHQVAKDLSEDSQLVWYTDCDYLFGEGCLDSVWDCYRLRTARTAIMFPKTTMTNTTHKIGDDLIQQARNGVVEMPDPSLFMPKRNRHAIGGVQITPAEIAREAGYLPAGNRYLKQVTNGKWQRCKGDVHWRKYMADYGATARISLDGLFRIRHTENGRDG